MNWKHWLYGLGSAVINGVAVSIVAAIADPSTFNLQDGAGKLGMLALTSAIISTASYLKQAPLPKEESDAPQKTT